jgi:hypothetical protein
MRLDPAACLALLLAAAPAAAEGPPDRTPASSATLPLERLLELHDQARAEKPKPARPPVAAAVTEAALSGRLLDRALDVTAQFKVAVLAEEWVRVPLMRLDAAVHVQSVTPPENGTVVIDGGMLVLVTRTAGEHAVQVSLLKDARPENRRRRVELVVEQPAAARMRLRFDAGLFRLSRPGAIQAGEEHVLYPERDRFVVEWETRAEVAQKPKAVARPTVVEPVITSAQASVVCNLEGLQIARIVYELRLQGTQQIGLAVPRNGTLARVLVNGTPAPFAVQDGAVRIAVAPARPGDESARLELVVQGPRREFHLSGRLQFAFPAASWNTHVLAVVLHLPVVFDYAWAGGSLAPAEQTADAEPESDLPMPGKVLRFRQELISSSPDVAVDYTVDLKGQYFGG